MADDLLPHLLLSLRALLPVVHCLSCQLCHAAISLAEGFLVCVFVNFSTPRRPNGCRLTLALRVLDDLLADASKPALGTCLFPKVWALILALAGLLVGCDASAGALCFDSIRATDLGPSVGLLSVVRTG